MTVANLIDERNSLVKKAGAILDRARASGREMTAEEENNFNRFHDAAADIKQKIDAAKDGSGAAMERRQRVQEEAEASLRRSRGRQVAPGGGAVLWRSDRASAEYARDFSAYIHTGQIGAELQADQLDKGGYLVPTEYADEIAKTLDNNFWFRRLANVLPRTKADSVSMPRRTARMANMRWGAELLAPTADSQLAFGQTNLAPGWMVGEIAVSNSLLMSGVVDVDAFVQDEIAYAVEETEEQAFMVGDGVRKPLGVFVASDFGVPASRDVAGTVSTDSLYDVKFSLREPYLRSPNVSWLGSRQFVKACAKLKDSNNNPLWVVSVREGEPDRLLGIPLTMSEYVPTGSGGAGAYQAGDYPAIIGDFKNYDVLDGIDMSVQRLVELEARRNMVIYIVRRKVTGCARHGEAFARLKIA